MKSKYEISIWNDIPDEETGLFKEEKLIIIGSDTMTSEARAREPKLVTNVNGSNKFSFNMYYSYIDTRTGEKVKNPYINFLINERKIKVFWKDKWYDFLIKSIKEDQVNHLFTYNCEDAFITELSRTGFNLTFNTELENNIGTARELIEHVIEDTDWQFDEEGSDFIYQETEEPVYEAEVLESFQAYKNPNDELTRINSNLPVLIFYSCAPDINNLKTTVQFYYSGTNTWEQDLNDMLVINGTSYTTEVTWDISETTATARRGSLEIFRINFATGLSTRYRAKRFVQSQKTVYNNIVDRYINVYNEGALLGYQETEFNDAMAVVNLITNPSNFANVSGWVGDELYFKLSPEFTSDVDITTYKATSYLYLKSGVYFNTGIQNNRPYTPNGFTVGENYIFRLKLKYDGTEPANTSYVSNYSLVTPSIQSRNQNYEPTGIRYFNTVKYSYDEEEHWLEYTMTCVKSCPYEMILSSSYPFGIFIDVGNANYWLEEAQFFKEVFGCSGYDDETLIRINPGAMSLQSVAQGVWRYFSSNQPEGTTKNDLTYIYTSLTPWAEATPVYNGYEKYASIEIDNSNRFNILQTIAETFECWVMCNVKHDDKGYILYDNGLAQKFIQIRRETGEETGIGFVYGIDLKSIVRNIKSDKISTKTIVEQNENEFGKNGFCTIARSEQNYPRENFIYNFDYYIQQGLLSRQSVYDDLYNTTGMAYYSQLHLLNVEYAKNLDNLSNKKIELTKQNAMSIVYNQYLLASREELQNVEDSLMKLAGVTDIDAALEYARTHARDTKVQSLINDRSRIKESITIYSRLYDQIEISISKLNDYITEIQARQNEIIEALTFLNKQFYVKYSRFIQEGTWTSEDYWDDDLYYLDAVQVAYTSSRPEISYEINVLRLSDLELYSSKIFKLGDISFVQDTEYFGYCDDKITPFKEKVILTEITSYFETPDKDTIKVQNYKTQFDDLFQRITAAVQNLEFSQGKYAKAANIIASDGTIRSSVIQNTFNENKDLVYGAQNESAVIDNTGITVTDNANASKQVKVTSGGVFVTDDAGLTWKNAIRGDGISTDLLTAGRINTEQITVYNGDYPSFRWDSNGLNAYKFNSDGRVDTTQFVRFDQYGIYGIQNAPEVYVPSSENQIYNDANFGLTWTKFFMKSTSGGKYIEISTERDIVVNDGTYDRILIGRVDGPLSDNYGIKINNQDGDVVFRCDDEGSLLSGWTLTPEFLESSAGLDGQTIKIYADGNIGCYGTQASEKLEAVYTITTVESFAVSGLNTDDKTFRANEVIYPFVSIVGKTKTTREVDEQKNEYMTPAAEFIPQPPSRIQIAQINGNKTYNYLIEDIVWQVSLNQTTVRERVVQLDKDHTVTTYIYTYTFNLIANKNNKTIFAIPYTENPSDTKYRYIPASNTKWKIDNNGDAVFHEIFADGGSIAGWWIDSDSIYQTYDGTRNKIKNGSNNVKTELSSTGTANRDGIDYSFITDALNAAVATIAGINMNGGCLDGYSIAMLVNLIGQAQATADYAQNVALRAYDIANTLANSYYGHKHWYQYQVARGAGITETWPGDYTTGPS